ncbi:NlpC/P60 family protein [Actinoplanes sp. NPDC049681]|uniref:NlpC/P60 family protein n=1 Tax=Actinoplanes sp. NPDC049681 TaxID=3363905 RepID=UPI0037A2C7E5
MLPWRPLACSAATAAAIAALFSPLPAAAVPAAPPAAPGAPPVPGVPAAAPGVPGALPAAALGAPGAVPDAGSRPIAIGAITLPGQKPGTPTAPATVTPVTGVATTPLLKKVEAGRTAIAAKGEELDKLDEDLNLTRTQLATADQKVVQGQQAVTAAQQEVEAAAATAVRSAAALPPGTLGSGLQDLDSLARLQRGESATQQAAARQLTIVQAAFTAAVAEQQSLRTKVDQLTTDRTKKKAALDKKVAAQQKFEQEHAAEINAADAAQAAQDAQIGADYLAGENAGRGADPRAIAALKIALAQRGDPYVWSEEGPNMFDCSGLVYYSYRSEAAGSFPLARVSKDQYYQTRGKTVDRYSLLPGDLLFFSSSASWTGIHHVAMYAGKGMMVEAPRTGLNVRLTPVRWSRLFSATRIYGSVEGTVEGPALGAPDPETPSNHSPSPQPSSKPPTSPKPSTSSPSPKPSSSSPSPKPSSSSPSPKPSSSSPSPKPSSSSPSPKPSGTPSATSAPPTGDPSPTKSQGQGTSPSNSAPTSGSTKTPTASATSSKAPASSSSTSKPVVSASASKSAEAKQSGNG